MIKTIDLGKVNYHNANGRKLNRVAIKVELEDGRLSISGEIWNASGTDWRSGGQNLEEIARLFPHDRKVQRIIEVWRRWHLNDMRAGDPTQEAYLRKHGHGRNYDETCRRLEHAGILTHNGYRYGTAWLTEELPAEIVAEVESW